MLVLFQVVEVLRGYLEHVSCTLTVRSRDQRCMEIVETMLMEISMDSHRHIMTDTHYCTKGIGTQTHVRVLTHSLETLALLLHGVVVAAQAVNLKLCSLNLRRLTCALTLNQCTNGTNTGTCSDIFKQLLVELGWVDYYLYVLDGRPIIEGDKVYGLRAAMRTHPTLHAYIFTIFCALQHINNLSTFHFSQF